jgi:hypothetical protein
MKYTKLSEFPELLGVGKREDLDVDTHFIREVRGKGKRINLTVESQILNRLMTTLPDRHSEVRLISQKGFSAINFVRVVADHEIIQRLMIATWCVGNKQLSEIVYLKRCERIKEANLSVGRIMGKSKKTGLAMNESYKEFEKVCNDNGIECKITRTHAKVIMMLTDTGNYYVIETSANFNENKCLEQFTMVNDKQVFEFYENGLDW